MAAGRSSDPGAASRPSTLVYDAECALCRTAVRGLRDEAASGALRLRSLHDRATFAAHPQLDPARCAHAVHLVLPDGRVLAGAAALLEALRGRRWGRVLASAYARSGAFRSVADGLYALVARHRRRGQRSPRMRSSS